METSYTPYTTNPLFHDTAPPRESKTPPVSHPSATFGLGILGA